MNPSSFRKPVVIAAGIALLVSAGGSYASPSTVRAANTYTAFTIDGESGSSVGGGVPQVYTKADSSFATGDQNLSSTPGYVLLIINGTSGTAAGHWYYVHLAAPPGEDLAVGTYSGAVRAAFRGTGQPGIDVYGDGVGCNDVAGQFTVHQISFSGPTLTAFSASYSFLCDNQTAHVAGEVRYQSSDAFAGLRQLPPDPTALDFGFSNVVGEASAPRETQLVNLGTTTIGLSAFGIDGQDPADYAQSAQTCGTSLAPGESCAWHTTFDATAPGYRYATAHFTSDVHGFVHGQSLAGFAAAATPQLQISPANKAFGSVSIGGTASQVFTVTSVGNVPVVMGARSITGPNAAEFGITSDTCPASLDPTMSCAVTAEFKPTTDGAKSAALTIAASDPSAPYNLPLTGNAVNPPSGLAWGSTYAAGPPYTWNEGGSLGRTVQSGSQRLHLAYATDRIGSSWAKDTGPYAGVYYVRKSSTWTTPKRLNPSTQHAEVVGLAAAGSRVYVVWESQTRIIRYSPTAPRALYVRVNTNHGGSTSWRSIVRLTSTTGRIDFPTVAASLTDAHIAWTDSNTGAIKLASSRNLGVNWTTVTLGSTTLNTTDGRSGVPSVGVWGSTVAVAWLADGAGTVKARVSTNRGVSWGPIETIGNGANSSVSVAVRGYRIAVAWTTADDVLVNQNQAGVWGTAVVVSALPPGGPTFPYGAAVALQDPNRIAVSWAETRTTAHYVDLRWAESANGGSLWFQPQTLASASSSSARRGNSWPSIVWPAAGTRYVVWNGWTYNTNDYRLYLRAGSGTPTGTLSAASAWTTTAPSGIPAQDPGRRVSVGSRTGPGARVQDP